MIRFTQGNLLEANVDAFVNTVNTVGVMGKGVALQFRRAFPEIEKPYKAACKSGELTVGKVLTIPVSTIEGGKYVINFPTKKHWKGNSKLEYVQSGLVALEEEIKRLNIQSIAIPPLGCGLGGLSWPEVKQQIVDALSALNDVEIVVYEPVGTPDAVSMKTGTKKPSMTVGRALLLSLMQRYLAPLMEDDVSLIEIHKLTYFMQEAGQPLKLRFSKGLYGPYSTNLNQVLKRIEGHYIVGFGDGSEEPGKEIHPKPGAFEAAEEFLADKTDERNRLDRVQALIEGFETAYGMELLGSVHWVGKYQTPVARTTDEAVQFVHQWNKRKMEVFPPAHVRVAWNRLIDNGWLP